MTARAPRTLSPQAARRLAIAAQWLDRPQHGETSPDAVLEVFRQLGCIQLDPISAVARSHQLVLWSRLGPFAGEHLDHLLWRERCLFEYWAHAASIVLTEDYPIHSAHMHHHRNNGHEWVRANDDLRRHILETLAERGPLMSRDFEDKSFTDWYSSGWTSNRNVSQMIQWLWISGQIMVVGRRGGQKVWDLAERALPEWTPRYTLPDDERVERSVEKALKALGVGTAKHINNHYTRYRYPGMAAALSRLEQQGRIERVQIGEAGRFWPGVWYLHRDYVELLDELERRDDHAETRLLSPFDNLICDRARTEQLFDFFFRVEIYVPKAKREYGYYVLPILRGDRLIGRIDPLMDRKHKVLKVNAVYAEPIAPLDDRTGAAVAGAIRELASFLGAKSIDYGEHIPEGWASALRRES